MKKSLVQCMFHATMLSLATKRTFGVRRHDPGPAVELFELFEAPANARVHVHAAYGSARDMRAYLEGWTHAAQQRSERQEPAGSILKAAFVLGPDDEQAVMEIPYRELGDSAIVHLPEDDPAAPCRSYVVAVDLPDEVVFVAILAAPAPTPAPMLAELERVAVAVVVNTRGSAHWP